MINPIEKDLYQFLTKFKISISPTPVIPDNMRHRIKHLKEELAELQKAVKEQNKEEFIDANIDIIYLALGNIVMGGFKFNDHWEEVHKCNMNRICDVDGESKKLGIRKPEGWVGPDHNNIFNKGKNNAS